MTTKNGKAFPIPVRAKPTKYSCSKCPAYCCSYPEIEVTPRDIERLAKHFELPYREAEERFTKYDAEGEECAATPPRGPASSTRCARCSTRRRAAARCTRRARRCAASYPDSPRCGYYEFLKFERAHQDDPKFIALT